MTDVTGRAHTTATLYEASGLDCACAPGLRPAWPGTRLAGPANTVQGVGGDNLALHNAVAAAPPGHVLVADLQGAVHGHWGKLLAVAAQARGLLGLVIDGGVRDVTELAHLDFSVFSSSVAVFRTTKTHPGVLALHVPPFERCGRVASLAPGPALAQRRTKGLPAGASVLIQTVLVSRYSWIASMPFSRPMPESLKPPKGARYLTAR